MARLATVPLAHVGRPIFSVAEAMGSGKTTIQRLVKRTWDPTAPETVHFDPRDFLQKVLHAFIVMLDNQNTVPEWAAETLCRLVTGEADSKCRLYTSWSVIPTHDVVKVIPQPLRTHLRTLSQKNFPEHLFS